MTGKSHKKLIINDWVRTIKQSFKGFNLSNPLQIVSLVRPGVYKLSDNTIWNGARLTKSNKIAINNEDWLMNEDNASDDFPRKI
ncbi:hypothetical protein A3Q56_06620 [Intoshia linei]|uniref:Uncharacterized protein n=1 Tax=Intoshia linei TaxID=1819745 RepID=A0A177AVS6_9BILA|nr:hypothetical protein A3Q56_06620 [Intoshia linei]